MRIGKWTLSGGHARLVTVVCAAVVVAFVLWLVLPGSNDNGNGRGNANGNDATSHDTLSQTGLQRAAAQVKGHVYWVGPRTGMHYEMDRTPSGRVYVRYLPGGVQAGDPRPKFLTVATYPLAHPLADLRRAAAKQNARRVKLPGGALAMTRRSDPRSAFLAQPGSKAQIEIFDPTAGQAMRLILAGLVQPVP